MRERVTICECFARDGLQHEQAALSTHDKIAAIDSFTRAGFKRIEATSYSHPTHVPAFADASVVLKGMVHGDGVFYKATCPNLRAIERARADLDAGFGANEISLLVSATEAHTERNLRTTRAAQWATIAEMVAAANGRFRLVGVISMAFGCPFEGAVDPGAVVADVQRFADLGVELVALGDTNGHATPSTIKAMIKRVFADVPGVVPVAHFHDSRGLALANCMAALDAGCRYFDSAFGGVGGHPTKISYGDGFTGNAATEDLVNLLEAEGCDTGLNLDRVMESSRLCEKILGRSLESRVARAGYGLIGERMMQDA